MSELRRFSSTRAQFIEPGLKAFVIWLVIIIWKRGADAVASST